MALSFDPNAAYFARLVGGPRAGDTPLVTVLDYKVTHTESGAVYERAEDGSYVFTGYEPTNP